MKESKAPTITKNSLPLGANCAECPDSDGQIQKDAARLVAAIRDRRNGIALESLPPVVSVYLHVLQINLETAGFMEAYKKLDGSYGV